MALSVPQERHLKTEWLNVRQALRRPSPRIIFQVSIYLISLTIDQRPVSRAGSITSFCSPLNLGLAASGASPRMMHSEVVRKAPTWETRLVNMKGGKCSSISSSLIKTKPVLVFPKQISGQPWSERKHNPQVCEPWGKGFHKSKDHNITVDMKQGLFCGTSKPCSSRSRVVCWMHAWVSIPQRMIDLF